MNPEEPYHSCYTPATSSSLCRYYQTITPSDSVYHAEYFMLKDGGTVTTTEELQPLLLAEALRDDASYRSSILTPRLRAAAKSLRQREGVVVHRTDKTAAFVLINEDEYLGKLDFILQDQQKFQRLNRNPIDDIKREANNIIEGINAVRGATHLSKICGDFDVGYLYGNVKTHKNGNPLRPIISQCPTLTYQLAKNFNRLLTPYIPDLYRLKSSTDFLRSLANAHAQVVLASLDVERFFTNIPVDETVQLLLDRIYRDEDTPTLDIPENSQQRLLQLCTKEAPFCDQRSNLYKQIDGVAMGSHLGVLFTNAYLGFVEQRVFQGTRQPAKYNQYIDDTFSIADSHETLDMIRRAFEMSSVLRLTCEFPQEGVLPFLDVRIKQDRGGLHTLVYHKPTNLGLCLNGNSEFPSKYKTSVISSFVRHALSHCSTWNDVHQELENITQQLVNNGYANKDIQRVTKTTLDHWYAEEDNNAEDSKRKIKLFYKGFMHKDYKKDEAIMRKIVSSNGAATDPDSEIDLIIYYKNKRTSQMLMKNSPRVDEDPLKKHGVVYRIICPVNGCTHSYIGMTTTRLSKRLSIHLQEGNFHQHYTRTHGELLRTTLLQATFIIDRDSDRRRLRLKEALQFCG